MEGTEERVTAARAAVARIESALASLRRGGLVAVTDDAARENEGDLVAVAETVTPEIVNFMVTYGRGLLCQPITAARALTLDLPLMVRENTESFRTAFTVSVDAAAGVSTGISAADRARTIRLVAGEGSGPRDLARPGHIFPLIARERGVFDRAGHTEAAVDLARLAGFRPSAVICEILGSGGSMARGPELKALARRFHLPLASIQDLLTYRDAKGDASPVAEAHARMATAYGDLEVTAYSSHDPAASEVIVLAKPYSGIPLVRLHSECLTGETFRSRKCDCGGQLEESLRRIGREGGLLLYLRQEGRGIGLAAKIRAYVLQDEGLDTCEANQAMGFPADLRRYGAAAAILRSLSVFKVRLLTNNPDKVNALSLAGIEVVERLPLVMEANDDNRRYLETKVLKMGHIL